MVAPGGVSGSRHRRFFAVDDDFKPRTPAAKPVVAAVTASDGGGSSGTTISPTSTTRRDARARAVAGETNLAHQLHQRLTNVTASVRDNFEIYSGGDDTISKRDLERVRDSNDPRVTSAMKDHARYLLEHPAALNALDTGAHKGDVDGKISREDANGAALELEGTDWVNGETIGVEGAIDSEDEAVATLERYRFLTDTAGGKGGRNGHYSNDDVEAIAADTSLPPDLREAAQYIIDNDVDLPGDGSSLFGTLTSPFRAGADWFGDRGGDVLDAGRDYVFGPSRLSEEERAELDEAAANADNSNADLPMNEQNNAHHTNTAEEMQEALEGDYQWLEGDIRRDPPIMAHDYQSNDGMSLEEWLAIGKESGRGMKLDIKEGESVDSVIAAVQASGIPEDKLIFNADVMAGPGGEGRNVAPEDLFKIRAAFPNAIIAIGTVTGETDAGTTYTEAQVSDMIALAEAVGGPVMFPLRAELVTPQIVERLEAHGTVAIWSSPSTYPVDDVAAEEERFREMGVTGIIDLRP